MLLLLCLLILATVVATRGTRDTYGTRPDAARGLNAKSWAGKRRRVNSRHPNPSLVDLEQVRDK